MTPLHNASVGARTLAGAAISLFPNPLRLMVGQISDTDCIVVDRDHIATPVLVGLPERDQSLSARRVESLSPDGGISKEAHPFPLTACPRPTCSRFGIVTFDAEEECERCGAPFLTFP